MNIELSPEQKTQILRSLFNDSEWSKLTSLATRRKTTVTNVLRQFAQAIVPGDTWKHPSDPVKK